MLAAVAFVAVFSGSESPAQRAAKTFDHNTREHKLDKSGKAVARDSEIDCNYCHTVPTRNWVTRGAGIPDVADYPFNRPGTRGRQTHTACFGCHTNDLYAAGGVFCAGCHKVAGPRARGGSGMRDFPNRAHGTQFETVFPHDLHQDVLARNDSGWPVAAAHFVKASFVREVPKDDDKFYNCGVCHQTAKKSNTPQPALGPISQKNPRKVVDDPDKAFNGVAPDFFKTGPVGHASCFNCHYQRTAPVSTDCAGCHKLVAKRSDYQPPAAVRYSLKFSHEEIDESKAEDHAERMPHRKDCMTCHQTIAGSGNLAAYRAKKEPEVPISTCLACHKSHLGEEIEQRKKETKEKPFTCRYCHTSAVGRYDMPANHDQ